MAPDRASCKQIYKLIEENGRLSHVKIEKNKAFFTSVLSKYTYRNRNQFYC